MCSVDKYGFTYGNPKQSGRKKGFKTGDIVKAIVTEGKYIGVYIGRVAARATGSFNITTKGGTIQGIGHQYCRALHRSDGYSYQKGRQLFSLNQRERRFLLPLKRLFRQKLIPVPKSQERKICILPIGSSKEYPQVKV